VGRLVRWYTLDPRKTVCMPRTCFGIGEYGVRVLFGCSIVGYRNMLPLFYRASSSVGGAGGNPAYRSSAFEAVCTLTLVLVPRSFPEALHARRRERPLFAK
jgi:hypothetical protein